MSDQPSHYVTNFGRNGRSYSCEPDGRLCRSCKGKRWIDGDPCEECSGALRLQPAGVLPRAKEAIEMVSDDPSLYRFCSACRGRGCFVSVTGFHRKPETSTCTKCDGKGWSMIGKNWARAGRIKTGARK